MTRSLLAVLVPARNAVDYLPGFFRSVGGFADVVVALDDGSTDSTRRFLDEEPLVELVLTNPRRPSYEGWDDAANRRRLVAAAAQLDVEWLMFLDADERIDEIDGRALREFLKSETISGFAYGFQVFRMAGDESHFDPAANLWVYRLFANEKGQDLTLPSKRLHFVPVPVAIDRQRWLRTTVRIQHLGSLTPAHRRDRFEKYRAADPEAVYQYDYGHLLDDPAEMRAWQTRPEDLPILIDEETRLAEDAVRQQLEPGPRISAVVIAQGDERTIEASLGALQEQNIEGSVEIILVTSGGDGTAELVRSRFPSVRTVDLPKPVLPGEARNHGLWMARAEYVSFPGSHRRVEREFLSGIAEGHDAGYDLVTSATVNGNDTRAGWASYFLDHSTVLPDRPSGQLIYPPAHASFVRDDLDALGGFPEDMRAGEDTVAILRIFRNRRSAYFAATSQFVHSSPCRTPARLIHHHFVRGRGWGTILAREAGRRSAVVARRWSVLLRAPLHRLRSIRSNVAAWGGGFSGPYRRVRGLIALGALSSWLGTWYQLTLAPPAEAPAVGPLRAAAGEPSVLVCHYGSPASMHLGVAGRGNPATAASRVVRHSASLAEHRPTTPALNILATAATVTPGYLGDHVARLPERELDRYVAAARDSGARIVIGIQPGLLRYSEAIEAHERYLLHDDVDVSLQPDYGVDSYSGSPPRPSTMDVAQLGEALRYLDRLASESRRSRPIRLIIQTAHPESARSAAAAGAPVTVVIDTTGSFRAKLAWCEEQDLAEGTYGMVSDFRTDPEPIQWHDLNGTKSPEVVVFR